jgi:hypothetical protein
MQPPYTSLVMMVGHGSGSSSESTASDGITTRAQMEWERQQREANEANAQALREHQARKTHER